RSIHDVLEMTVDEACRFYDEVPAVTSRLESLQAVGLGYLTLGQPLNTLSGGESQRLKLVRYLPRVGTGQQRGRGKDKDEPRVLLLLDEPTTGLHRHDISKLIAALQKLVNYGHSLVVIEHQTDVIKCADWVIE